MELLLRIVGVLLRIVGFFIVRPVLGLLYKKETGKVPKITNDLLKICAVDLAEKIRNKEVRLSGPVVLLNKLEWLGEIRCKF